MTEHNTAPPWIATFEISSLALTRATFSSAPTKTAMSPRKCTDATGMPIGSGRTRSVIETMEAPSPGSNSFITW